MIQRLFARSIMALSVVCTVGSLALFIGFPLELSPLRRHWSESESLWWDALLSFAFFLQHSGMVRRRFRETISRIIPPHYYPAMYGIASGVVLTGVVILWQPTSHHLLTLAAPFAWVAPIGASLAIALFLWGVVALRSFDMFGLGSITAQLRGAPEPASELIIRGPYRWVRHPWYLAVIILIWSTADITTDRLLFNVLWTGWICIGARLEERDLIDKFGDAYRKYRRQVPMLLPWRGRALGNSMPARSDHASPAVLPSR